MRDRRQKMFNYVLAGGLGGKRTKRKQKEVKTICVLSIESLFWGKKETLFSRKKRDSFFDAERFCGGSKFFWVVLVYSFFVSFNKEKINTSLQGVKIKALFFSFCSLNAQSKKSFF